MGYTYQKIIDQMNLEEKCALLQGGTAFKTKAFKRLGIPEMEFSDGPHGLRKQAEGANHLGLGGSVKATCFPTAAAIADSWDPSLCEEVGEALAEEAAASSVSVLLGPGLNIKRSPLCGRDFEYFSEDPYLAGKMAAGYVRGIQKEGLSACPKHFAVNSQELCRMSNDSIVDERTLREIYLTGFEIAIKESDPKTIMTSYNRVNGSFANENQHLLQDILKGEWGYQGAIVTDWGGSNDHAAGVKNGSDFEMPAAGNDSIYQLVCAVKKGQISESDINDRVDEALKLIFETRQALEKMQKSHDLKPGTGAKTQSTSGEAKIQDKSAVTEAEPAFAEKHHALARKAAAESIVLLKNKNGILPLEKGSRVAFIGDFAETPRYQGAGSSLVNPMRLDKIDLSDDQSGYTSCGYAKGYLRSGKEDKDLLKEAVTLAKSAEKVLLFMGLTEDKESEGLDRNDMKINQNQINLLRAVSKANPHVIVVLCGGSSVEMPWIKYAQAIVYTGLGGQAWAPAVMDVITGKVNPSGKLTETYAMELKDTPCFRYYPGKARTSEYREGMYVGYRYYETTNTPVRFPFGFGLSYTSFEYSDMKTSPEGISVTVTNTGKMDGTEIVQFYVHKENSIVFRPAKELKGFARVFLKQGESKAVKIPFDEYTFRYFDVKKNAWVKEGGEWTLMAGASAADIRTSSKMLVEGTASEAADNRAADHAAPYDAARIPSYLSGQITNVNDAEFKELLGHDIPDSRIVIDRNITFNQLNHGRSPIFWVVWLVMTLLKRSADKKGTPNLNLLFIYNMPLRGLQKMTGGMFSMGMVDALVMEVKGFWIIGFLRFIVEFILHQVRSMTIAKKLG